MAFDHYPAIKLIAGLLQGSAYSVRIMAAGPLWDLTIPRAGFEQVSLRRAAHDPVVARKGPRAEPPQAKLDQSGRPVWGPANSA